MSCHKYPKKLIFNLYVIALLLYMTIIKGLLSGVLVRSKFMLSRENKGITAGYVGGGRGEGWLWNQIKFVIRLYFVDNASFVKWKKAI